MKRILTILLTVMGICLSAAAQRYTISGYITDASSGEPIIGAAVIDKSSAQGVVTGNTGFFSISLESGQKTLIFSYLGYSDKVEELALNHNISLNVKLEAAPEQLANAVVTAHRNITGARSTQMSAIEVPINQIKSIPAIGGEVDVIKALQLLPGVQSGSEGSAGLYVRGGGADENLLLMDGVPLYNVNHLFGFFSVFNADAIKNVTLYKGSFPARFGGHLSSVIDVRMNDGNDSEIHGNVSIGLISSKFNLEGPIVKGKTTFNVSARRTYLDVLAKPLVMFANHGAKDDKNNYVHYNGGYDFYDLNSKITHKFDNGDRLSLSFYTGDDNARIGIKDASYYEMWDYVFDGKEYEQYYTGVWKRDILDTDMGWRWGNMVTSLRWNHEITPKLYMSANTSFTRYRSHLAIGLEENITLKEHGHELGKEHMKSSVNYNTNIGDWSATADFDWSPEPRHDVKFGGAYTYHSFKPGIIALKMAVSGENADPDNNFEQTVGNNPIHSNEASVFAEDNWAVAPWLKANIGVHTSLYGVHGKTYLSAEPRLSLRALLTDKVSIKASYSEMSQYIHLLCNSNVSLPSDLWVPVTDRIKPMRSRQTAAGIFYDKGKFEYSVEAYWKTMDNVLEYKDGASYFNTSTGWEEKVAMGQGWSYGVEFFAQKKLGKTTGWIGYTWAKAMRRFDKPGMEINDGNPFPAKYDRRHDISATISHEFSKKFDVSATFVYASGNRGSLAYEYYPTAQLVGAGSETGIADYFYTSEYLANRNNYRMPAYNRLDVGMNYKKQKKHGTAIWNLSIYNVYNRLNPYLLKLDTHYEYDENGRYKDSWPVLKQISIFPIIPSISYTYRF